MPVWLTLVPLTLRLVRRELRGGLRGFGIFLACLFLGVFAISAIGNFSAAARSGLLSDAAALLGGDLEVRQVHRPLSENQRQALNARGQLSEVVRLRTMASAGTGHTSSLVELKAVDRHYPLYGALKLSDGGHFRTLLRLHAGHYGALVEPALLERLTAKVGDRLTIGNAELEIRGLISQEPDRSLRAFSLGPRVLLAPAALEATGLLQPGSLVTYSYRLRLTERERIDQIKAELQQQFPDAGWRLRDWRNAAPRVRDLLDRMETNLGLLGLCALLVGGLGVSGAVRGYLDGKLSHIATLKALGGSRRLLFSVYLLQILLLGLIGSAGGLLAGALLPWLLQQVWGAALPWPLEPGFFPGVWLSAALFGLLTALLFSLRALGAACRVSPAVLFRGYLETGPGRSEPGLRLALVGTALLLIAVALVTSPDRRLALWFVGGAGLSLLLFRGLAWLVIALLRRLPRPQRPALGLALAGIRRPGSPAAGIIFSLGIGLTALIMIVQVQGNLNSLVSDTLSERAPAYFLFDIQPTQLADLRQLVAADQQVERFAAFPTLRGRITAIDGVPVSEARIDPEVRWAVRGDRYLSYSADLPSGSKLVAGEWWEPGGSTSPRISLTADLAEGFRVGLGDSLDVNILGRTIRANIANLRQVDWSTLELNFAIIFSPGVLEAVPQTYLAAVHLPPSAEEPFYRRLTDRFKNISVVSVREVMANVARTLERIGWAFKGMAGMALLTGFLVLIGAVSADQHRRIREAVIFKVCGATRWMILQALATEFILLGLIAGVVSTLCGSLAAMALVRGPLEARFQLQPGLILITLAAGIGLTLVFGLLGTWKALGQKASTYLRDE